MYHATIDAFVQARTGSSRARTGTWGRGLIVFGLKFADRPACQLENLKGTDDPAPVVGMEAGGGRRVERGQTLVERRVAVRQASRSSRRRSS